MGKVFGLLNPKNATESSGGGFKEGNVLCTKSMFRVWKGQDYAGQPPKEPILALTWDVTRLDDNLEAMKDDDGGEVREQVVISLGGTSLKKAHPGMAESPESEEVEDLGDALNTEGPTVFVVTGGWFPDKRSGIAHLNESLIKAGFKEEIINRGWAPDFENGIYFMKTWIDMENKLPAGKDGVVRGTPYKVVEKVIRHPYDEAKKGAGKGKKAAGSAVASNAAASAPDDDASDKETILAGVLNTLSMELDGEELSRKAFNQRVLGKLNADQIDPKLHVSIMGLIKDDKWCAKNLKKYDMTFSPSDNSIQIGESKAA